jgi:hypothetical protein
MGLGWRGVDGRRGVEGVSGDVPAVEYSYSEKPDWDVRRE